MERAPPPNLKMTMVHITCLKRVAEPVLPPAAWLSRLREAASNPLEVAKAEGVKRTVATKLAPWGRVCLQDVEWILRKSVLSAFRPFRGRRSWQRRLALLEQGIPAIEPLLYLEVRHGPFVVHTYNVSRWLECENLGKTARNRNPVSDGKFFDVLKRASALAAAFHDKGFVHGDLKWSNFLWIDKLAPKVLLSDLDHVERSASAEKQGKDLARFLLSALEFGMGWETAQRLSKWYFENRKARPAGLEKYLSKHIEKKRKKYEKRCSEACLEKDPE